MRARNRISFWLDNMAKTPRSATRTTRNAVNGSIRPSTEQKQEWFSRNIKWECDRKNWSREKIHSLLAERFEKFSFATLTRWFDGETANPERRFREALADLFGYADIDSIVSEDHVDRRAEALGEKIPDVSPKHDRDFANLMSAFASSESMTDDERLALAAKILKSPRASVMLSVTMAWLENRMT